MNPYIGDRQLDSDETQHECPGCGYEFDELQFHDAGKCPSCGYKLLQPDDEPNDYPEEP